MNLLICLKKKAINIFSNIKFSMITARFDVPPGINYKKKTVIDVGETLNEVKSRPIW